MELKLKTNTAYYNSALLLIVPYGIETALLPMYFIIPDIF